MMALSPIIISRLEKGATDNGFDREIGRDDHWLSFASTQCPLQVWLGTYGDSAIVAAFSQHNVADATAEYGTAMAAALPDGAAGGRVVQNLSVLHRLLRRAFQLSRALPNELLHNFENRVALLPCRISQLGTA